MWKSLHGFLLARSGQRAKYTIGRLRMNFEEGMLNNNNTFMNSKAKKIQAT